MASRALAFSAAALLSLATCSPVPATNIAAVHEIDVASLSWRITDFEWRTGYTVWSYYVGIGPAPPPPPTQTYNCGQAMLRMNITVLGARSGTDLGSAIAQEEIIQCVEQTNDAKLANITDMKDYNAGPWGPPPPSPHWFTCDIDNQLFIYPNGTLDPWADADQLGNSTTQIRMDPEKKTLAIRQIRASDDKESGGQAEITGIADLPPLSCRDRPSLESDANFLINSPVMHGPGLGGRLRNGSVCTGPEFLIKGHVSEITDEILTAYRSDSSVHGVHEGYELPSGGIPPHSEGA
ncbi:hypothetical protein F4802DRAFT_547766 [Xylaria palmicola]|nr:hypothetical protein F4802DRAFT_547766 [Xylaria palmicola]